MRVSTIAERIPLWYKNKISFHLSGQPGIGKTAVINQAAERLREEYEGDFGLIVINGAATLLPDAIGLGSLYKFTDKNKKERVEMRFSEPFFSRTKEGKRWDDYSHGLLFIDEYDKCEPDLKKVFSEAKSSGRLGPHWMPDGWLICTAGNRATDRSGSTKWFDHDINRTMWIDVKLPFMDWEAWASSNGVMPVTIAYAKQNQAVVFPETVPEKQGPWCTPRSLVKMDAYFQSIIAEVGHLPDDEVIIEEASGITGAANAHHYFAFLRVGATLPTVEQIIYDPVGTEVPPQPDGQMIVCYNLAKATTPDNVNAITTYVNRCDAEFAHTYYRAAVKANSKLVMNKNFAKWAVDNSKLMALLYKD